MVVNEIKLEEQLKKIGTLLLNPPSDIEELLHLLDEMECLLVSVEQAPSISMHDAILLPMKALISSVLLRHSDDNVRVSVASCISEITRITAPDVPYNDDEMKEFFRLAVKAFGKLSLVSSCYAKAVSILDTFANVRSCLMMLDMELDDLVTEMCKCFLEIISSNHPDAVFCAMEKIMTLVIDDSDNISWDLISILLTSVRKKNQSVSPTAWKLGEKVMINCSAKLKPYLKEAVQSAGIAFKDYSTVVASICQDERCDNDLNRSPAYVVKSSKGSASIRDSDRPIFDSYSKELDHHSLNHQSNKGDAKGNDNAETKLEMERKNIGRKMGRKFSSLMNPEEGNGDSWIHNARKAAKKRSNVKRSASMQSCVKKRITLNSFLDEHVSLASLYKKIKLSGRDETGHEETPKAKVKQQRTPKKEMDSKTPKLGEDLIGCRIKVWWPLDKTFYYGAVDSYNPAKKMHKILYDDGEEEILNLQRQRWELADKDSLLQEGKELDLPNPSASVDTLQKRKAKGKIKSGLGEKLKPCSSSRSSKNVSIRKTKSSSGNKSKSSAVYNDGMQRPGSDRSNNGKVSCSRLKIVG